LAEDRDATLQIVIERVSHVYRLPRGRPVTALDNVSLDITDREFVALLGPSRCGKMSTSGFLAERIAVMSARPGHIKEIVETRFDKDDPGLACGRAFVGMVDHVWNPVRGVAILAEREAVA